MPFDLQEAFLEISHDVFSRRIATSREVYLHLASKYAARAGLELHSGTGNAGSNAFASQAARDPKYAAFRSQIVLSLEGVLQLHEKFLDALMSGANEDPAPFYQQFLSNVAHVYEAHGVKPTMVSYIAKLYKCVCDDVPATDDMGKWLLTDEQVLSLLGRCKQLPQQVLGIQE